MKDDRSHFSIRIKLKDGKIFLQCPKTITTPEKELSHLVFPCNKKSHVAELVFIVENYNILMNGNTTKKLNYKCTNITEIHSACLSVEFFSRIGWQVFHESSWGIDGSFGKHGYVISHPLRYQDYKKYGKLYLEVSIIHEFGTSLILNTYDSLRIASGYEHHSSILAHTMITTTNYFPTNKMFKFFFNYHYQGINIVDIAFDSLNDPMLVPLHDYIVQEIGRGLTQPWSDEKIRKNIVSFLLQKPNRFKNFKKWMTKMYSSIGLPQVVTKFIDVIKHNIEKFKGAKVDEKHLSLTADQAESWWCIDRFNNKKYQITQQ